MEIAFLPSNYINNMMIEKIQKKKQENIQNKENLIEKFFPGIFLATSPSRFVRPVKNLKNGGIEYIGPLE